MRLAVRAALLVVAITCAAWATAYAGTGSPCAGAPSCPWSKVDGFGTVALGSVVAPAQLAISSTRVYVADPATQRVTFYSLNGSPLGSWGSRGTSNGQFDEITALAVGPNGNVYVGNHRYSVSRATSIEVFSPTGTYVDTIRLPASVVSTNSFLSALAFGANGHLYIADRMHDKVIEATADGAPIRTFGSTGSGAAQLSSPGALAVGTDGSVFVGDRGNHRIVRFTASGAYLGAFGAPGGGSWEHSEISAIAADDDGTVLVADRDRSRVARWSADGRWLGAYLPTGASDFAPQGLALLASGAILATDVQGLRRRLLAFRTDGTAEVWAGQLTSDIAAVEHIAVDSARGYVYALDPTLERLRTLDLGTGAVSSTGSWASKRPTAMAVGPDGKVAVVDAEDGDIDLYGTSGTGYIRSFSVEKAGYVTAVAWGTSGDLYMLDWHDQVVTQYSTDGALVRTFGGGDGGATGELSVPGAIAADPDGSIWVADSGSRRIAHFSAAGAWLGAITWTGTNHGYGASLSVAPDGRIASVGYEVVNILRRDGTLIARWGGDGSGPGEFNGLSSVAWQGNGTVWTGEWNGRRLQRFTLAPVADPVATTTTTPPTTPPSTPVVTTPSPTNPPPKSGPPVTPTPTTTKTPAVESSSSAASESSSDANATAKVQITLPPAAPQPAPQAEPTVPRGPKAPAAKSLEGRFTNTGRKVVRAKRLRLTVAPNAQVRFACKRRNCRKTKLTFAAGGAVSLVSALPRAMRAGEQITITVTAPARRKSVFVVRVKSSRTGRAYGLVD